MVVMVLVELVQVICHVLMDSVFLVNQIVEEELVVMMDVVDNAVKELDLEVVLPTALLAIMDFVNLFHLAKTVLSNVVPDLVEKIVENVKMDITV